MVIMSQKKKIRWFPDTGNKYDNKLIRSFFIVLFVMLLIIFLLIVLSQIVFINDFELSRTLGNLGVVCFGLLMVPVLFLIIKLERR